MHRQWPHGNERAKTRPREQRPGQLATGDADAPSRRNSYFVLIHLDLASSR
jgi:hypothetical protein